MLRFYLIAILVKASPLLLTIILLNVAFPAFASNQIKILELAPEPNYPLTKDPDDVLQLVDSKLVKFPAWTKRSSVGWKDSSIITITSQILAKSPEGCREAVLSIYTGHKPKAGVYIPRRIDIYTGHSNRKLVRSGHYVAKKDEYKRPQTRVLKSRIRIHGTVLVLFIHSSQRFTMIDEIELSHVAECSERAPNDARTVTLTEARAVSKGLLVSGLRKDRSVNRIEVSDKLKVEAIYPYARDLEMARSEATSGPSEMTPDVGKFRDLSSRLFRVSGKCIEGYPIEILEGDSSGLRLYSLQDVVSFSGQTQLDPLVPIKKYLPCSEKRNQAYLWVSLEPEETRITGKNYKLAIGAETNSVQLEIVFRKRDEPAICRPRVVTWGYSIDKPIWGAANTAYQTLQSAGINVHVIPPQILPEFGAKALPSETRKLEHEVRAVKAQMGDVKLLMFSRLSRQKFDRIFNGGFNKEEAERYLDWIGVIKSVLDKEKIQESEWYLYPFDELTSKEFATVIPLLSAITHAFPEMQLYANPINSKMEKYNPEQVRTLFKYFDMLQPNYSFSKTFHAILPIGEWWTYANPSAPAKDQSPEWYRMLGTRAWLMRAGGFGTWSFSDTSRSSAWDDFDGRRPDWAMVYEGEDIIYSSRRFEGFKEGISDYIKLCSSGLVDREFREAENLPKVDARGEELREYLIKVFDGQHNLR